jgi:hypothetical protein
MRRNSSAPQRLPMQATLPPLKEWAKPALQGLPKSTSANSLWRLR